MQEATLRGALRSLRARAEQMDPDVMCDAYALRDQVCAQIKTQTGDMAHDALLLVELIEFMEGVGATRWIHERMADRAWFHHIHQEVGGNLTGLVARRVAQAMLQDAQAQRGVFDAIEHNQHPCDLADSMGVWDALDVIKEYVRTATPLMLLELTDLEAGIAPAESRELLDAVVEGIFGDQDPLLSALTTLHHEAASASDTQTFETCFYLAARAWDYSQEYIDDILSPDDQA